MDRVPEPELMCKRLQAEAYANADFEGPHSRVIEYFDSVFSGIEVKGWILDLGCGPGDITFRFARHFKDAQILAVDGSPEMLRLAVKRKEIESGCGDRITFMECYIPGKNLGRQIYSLIISTSFLHHLPEPMVLWNTINEYAHKGTLIFIYDLMRPKNRDDARDIVEKYSGDEPDILKRDFYNSLLAAFRPEEVEEQLHTAGLDNLSVNVVSDRHIIVYGKKG